MEKRRDSLSDPMAANPDDPKLGVYCLTEFVFCPRAGLCTHEQEKEYLEEEPHANVYYLPIHDRAELERTLKSLFEQFWRIVLGGIIATVLCGVVAWVTGLTILGILAMVVAIVTVVALVERGFWAFRVTQYLAIWKRAEPRLPDPDTTKTQEIHWCELLAAGVTLREPQAPFTHDPWKFGGKPWKVLEYGDLRIPVFLHKADWKGLFPQHFVRMVAYCQLLEACEGFRSPYGVIVRKDTFAAMTVPNSAKSQEDFRRALARARESVQEAEESNYFPPVSGEATVCRDCHYGQPRVYRRGKEFLRYGKPIPVHSLPGPGRKKYHSHCGDRFRWTPPHKEATAMELGVQQ
jgi:hypothetical protein